MGARSMMWHRLMLLIALIVLVHQFVMLSPLHEHTMPMVFSSAAHAPTTHAALANPAHGQPVVTECPATVAVRFDLGALLVLLLVCLRQARSRFAVLVARCAIVVHWVWPPARRRAFLQVFLC